MRATSYSRHPVIGYFQVAGALQAFNVPSIVGLVLGGQMEESRSDVSSTKVHSGDEMDKSVDAGPLDFC